MIPIQLCVRTILESLMSDHIDFKVSQTVGFKIDFVGMSHKGFVEGYFSDAMSVISRVQLGLVLGPLLFAININNLVDKVVNVVSKFVEDTKLVASLTVSKGI